MSEKLKAMSARLRRDSCRPREPPMTNTIWLGVGKIKEKFYKDAISEYEKRLSRYCKLLIVVIIRLAHGGGRCGEISRHGG